MFWVVFLPLAVADVCPIFDPGPGPGYVPGTPGGPWTVEEVLIVKEKVALTTNIGYQRLKQHQQQIQVQNISCNLRRIGFQT